MNPGNILVAGVILILAQTVNSSKLWQSNSEIFNYFEKVNKQFVQLDPLTLLDGGLEQFQTTLLCHDYVVIGVAVKMRRLFYIFILH